jgi:hypothetical protein
VQFTVKRGVGFRSITEVIDTTTPARWHRSVRDT